MLPRVRYHRHQLVGFRRSRVVTIRVGMESQWRHSGRAFACQCEGLGAVDYCLYYPYLFPVVDKSDLKIGK